MTITSHAAVSAARERTIAAITLVARSIAFHWIVMAAVAVSVPDTCKRTTVVGVREPAADAQTIRPEADLLLVAHRKQ